MILEPIEARFAALVTTDASKTPSWLLAEGEPWCFSYSLGANRRSIEDFALRLAVFPIRDRRPTSEGARRAGSDQRPDCERNLRMALSSLFGLLMDVDRAPRRSARALPQRKLRMESLESRLALSTLMAVKVEATDLAGNPVTSVQVGDEFVLRATVQDLRPGATGVFAAYADVSYDPSKVALNGDITHGALYPNGPGGDTSVPGLIDDAGGFFNCTTFPCFGDGDQELLFSVPFVATAAGSVTFDVGPPNDSPPTPLHDALLFGLNESIPLDEIDFVDSTLVVSQPTAPDLLRQLISNVESIQVDDGVRNALQAKLNAALNSLTAGNSQGRQDGMNTLAAFIHSVEAQRGKKISDTDAQFLIDSATTIVNLASGNGA